MVLHEGRALFSSGEVSRMLHVSERTLRYYMERGIIEPTWTNEQNGYRYYSYEALCRIGVQRAAKRMGLSMDEYDAIAVEPSEFESGSFLRTGYRMGELMRRKREQISEMLEQMDELERIQGDMLLIAGHGVTGKPFLISHEEQGFVATFGVGSKTEEATDLVRLSDAVSGLLDYRFGRFWRPENVPRGTHF